MKIKASDIKKHILHILSGSILTEDFFVKNTRFLLILFVIVVFYISNRYSCISKMGEIQTLQRELKDVKYESLTISTELIGISRQSQVESLINKNEMALKPSKQPAYRIKK